MARSAGGALLLICVALLALASPKAHALGLHGYAPCPHGGPGGADQCGSQVANPSFIRPDFVTYSNQNGHTSVLGSVLPTWNWAGVHFGIGYGLGTLTKASTATLPSGCTFSSTGGGVNNTAPKVACSSPVNPDFEGIDFTDAGAGPGTACVVLQISNGSGTFKLANFHAQVLDTCTGPNGWWLNIFGGSTFTSKIIQDGQIDGNTAASGGPCPTCESNPVEAAIIDHGNDTPLTLLRVAATKLGGRLVDSNGYTPTYIASYLDGLNLGGAASGTHGEVFYTGTAARSSVAAANYSYTVNLCGTDCTINTGANKATNTTFFYASDGRGVGTTWTSVVMDHNVFVSNQVVQNGTPYGTLSVASGAPADNLFNQFTFTNNLVDPNGALYCTTVLGGGTVSAKTFSGNVNLYDGSAITDFDATHCAGASPQ